MKSVGGRSHLPQPCSMYFFALSHAPPAVFKNIANLGAVRKVPTEVCVNETICYNPILLGWFIGILVSGLSKLPCNWVAKSPWYISEMVGVELFSPRLSHDCFSDFEASSWRKQSNEHPFFAGTKWVKWVNFHWFIMFKFARDSTDFV